VGLPVMRTPLSGESAGAGFGMLRRSVPFVLAIRVVLALVPEAGMILRTRREFRAGPATRNA